MSTLAGFSAFLLSLNIRRLKLEDYEFHLCDQLAAYSEFQYTLDSKVRFCLFKHKQSKIL